MFYVMEASVYPLRELGQKQGSDYEFTTLDALRKVLAVMNICVVEILPGIVI